MQWFPCVSFTEVRKGNVLLYCIETNPSYDKQTSQKRSILDNNIHVSTHFHRNAFTLSAFPVTRTIKHKSFHQTCCDNNCSYEDVLFLYVYAFIFSQTTISVFCHESMLLSGRVQMYYLELSSSHSLVFVNRQMFCVFQINAKPLVTNAPAILSINCNTPFLVCYLISCGRCLSCC